MIIQLTQGREAVVDERDHELLSRFKWHFGCGGYAIRMSSKKDDPNGKHHPIRMHRIIWGKYNGPIPKGYEIDHINGNRVDNRLENLRLVTRSQNEANRKIQEHLSRFKGVSWYKRYGRWQARIWYDNVHHFLGYFDVEEEAARAYDAKAKEMFREFAKTNF